MLEELKKKVYDANMLLPKYGLVTFTWGNVSGIDKERKYFVIKPSGIEYDKLTPDDMVVMDLEGNRVEGRYNPSSDTKTHLIIYRNFKNAGGIVHTHSPYATGFAQAGADIACMGTTKLKNSFKHIYRCTISEYIRQRRMSHAEMLLTSTDLAIDQVALAVGYSNAGRFAANFKNNTGLFPSEYRKMAHRK